MKLLSTIWLLAVAAACTAGARTFANAATVTRMGDTLEEAALYLQGLAPSSQCVFGHLSPPAQTGSASAGLDTGYFGLLAHPTQDCPSCTLGFRVHTIHLLLYGSDGGVGYSGRVGLADVQLSDVGCVSPFPYPNRVDCEAEYLVDLPSAGFYDVAIPIECDCAVASFYPYLITVLSSPPMRAALLDAECNFCMGWYQDTISVSAPWFDRCNIQGLGYGFDGDVLYYVEADCCEDPVRDAGSSWGTLKALFGS